MNLSELAEKLSDRTGQGISYYRQGRSIRKAYAEVSEDVRVAVGTLRGWGVEPRMRVGLLAENSYQWIVYDLALLELNCLSVSFPPEEFAATSLEDLGEKYALHLLLISKKERRRRLTALAWVATIDDEGNRNAHVRRFDERAGDGNRDVFSLDADVLTLAFSSGTSGMLKCLLISRRGTERWLSAFGEHFSFRPDDSMLVVLPLSNYQQRLMVYTAIYYGFNLLLTDPAGLFRALKEMRPTILIGPPMFYEMAENRFHSLPALKRKLISAAGRAIHYGTVEPIRGKLKRKLFAPFYEAFGGNVRLMLTGMAPSRRSTLELFGLIGLPLYQVYGLTETCLIAWNLHGANRIGSVGKPVFANTVTLAADQEIIVEDDTPLSVGYLYCDEEEERRTYCGDKRIATGDIGRFDKDGYLYIVGRKKQTIITQGGYKVQPEVLEQAIERAPEVSRAVVFGGGELSGLVALVSLRQEDDAEVEKRVQSIVDKLNGEVPTASQIGRVVFTTTQFRADNGFLTRNLKIDRRAVYEAFRKSLLGLS